MTLREKTPSDLGARKYSVRAGFSLIELLLVLAIMGILMGLFLGAIQKVRERVRQLSCQNNLKQLAMAAEGFHTQRGHYPAGCSVQTDNGSHPFQSWITTLLPWLEQDNLARQSVEAFAKDSFFATVPHDAVRSVVLPVLICPSNPAAETPLTQAEWSVEGRKIGPSAFALTSYLGVGGKTYLTKDGILYLDSQIRSGDIADGKSQTILIGERPPGGKKHWGWWYAGWGMSKSGSGDFWLGTEEIPYLGDTYETCAKVPQPFRPLWESNPCGVFQFWAKHPSGAYFAYSDGSVRMLHYGAEKLLVALSTRAGSELVDGP